ncbi:MAG: hypothetical protein AAF799_18170 [Myxococcota bacterium]
MNRARTAIACLSACLGLGLLPGCGDDGTTNVGMTPPPPADGGAASGTTTGAGESTAATEPCQCRLDCTCPADGFCAAPFSVGDPVPADEAFVCQAECVPVGAIALWCSDDASCCEGSCGKDGVCHVASADEGTTDGGTDSSGSESGSSSSGGSSSSSGGDGG